MSHLQAGVVTVAVCVLAGVQLAAFLVGAWPRGRP